MSEFTRFPKLLDFTLRDMINLNQTRRSVLSQTLVTENRFSVSLRLRSYYICKNNECSDETVSSRLSFCCSSMLQVSAAHVPVHNLCCVCISILNMKRVMLLSTKQIDLLAPVRSPVNQHEPRILIHLVGNGDG